MRGHYSSGQQTDVRRGQRKNFAQLSPRAENLKKQAKRLGTDVLSAALGLSEDSVKLLIQGRADAGDPRYAVHLAQRLEELGLGAGLLDKPNLTINEAGCTKIYSAASRHTSKAPIRRSNFKRLYEAFSDRVPSLADALEMSEQSIIDVSAGYLELDEHRFGHLNPRLMAAGFPDSWLEEPNAELTEANIKALERLAVDSYEEALAALEEPEPSVAPTPTPSVAPSSQATMVAQHPPTQTTSDKEGQSMLNTPMPPVESAAEKTTSTGAALPRGVMRAGRAKSAAPKVSKKSSRKPSIPASAPAQSPLNLVGSPPPPPPGASQSAETPAAPRVHQVASRSTREEPAPEPALQRGDTPLSKSQSKGRADALQALFDQGRRGVSAHLWLRVLKKSQSYWGNVRSGQIMFNNDMADEVEQALELPRGWLDTPSFPPATLAPWVMNANLPIPKDDTREQVTSSLATEATVVEGAPPPAPPKAPTEAAPAKPTKPASRPFAAKTRDQEVTVTPAAVTPAEAAPAAAPVAVTPPTAMPTATGFTWKAATARASRESVGPLTVALTTVLQTMNKEGKFTEEDALRLLNMLHQGG